jgi:hypothetical protein
MLIIVSDLHLGDGTTATSIPVSAFYLFAKRLRQDAHFASLRNGRYRPIEDLDVLLLGDILDPVHSTKWFHPIGEHRSVRMTEPGDPDYIRPWSDPNDPKFAPKLLEVTRGILEGNREAMEVLRKLANGEFIQFDPINSRGERDVNSGIKIPLKVRFHYMVGNHDWYYHLKGEAFDQIRSEIIRAMGLSNPPSPFPHDLHKLDPNLPWEADEAPEIERLFSQYRVFGRHGDIFDNFNFDREKGRDYPTLGDAFATEVVNKYPEVLTRMPGMDPVIVDNLRRITNVRPALATPLWVSGQIRTLAMENKLNKVGENELKRVWDRLAEEFLQLDFVRRTDKAFKFDLVDRLRAIIKITKLVSFETIEKLTLRMQGGKRSSIDRSFARHALKEPAFLDQSANYIVYGHTHHHETIPLDYDSVNGNQIYFNSGTWHTYFDLARKDPKERKFIPYKSLTYITFYKPEEHDDRDFETWSGAYA